MKTSEITKTGPTVEKNLSAPKSNVVSLELKHQFIGNVTKNNKEQSKSLAKNETI